MIELWLKVVRGIPLAKAARVPQAGTGHRGNAVQGRN